MATGKPKKSGKTRGRKRFKLRLRAARNKVSTNLGKDALKVKTPGGKKTTKVIIPGKSVKRAIEAYIERQRYEEKLREEWEKLIFIDKSNKFRESLSETTSGIIEFQGGEEVYCETGASSDFFIKRIFDEVGDIDRNLDIIAEGEKFGNDIVKQAFLNPPSEIDSEYLTYIRNFLYELMLEQPDLFMFTDRFYTISDSVKVFLENIGKGKEWEYIERDDLGNIQVKDGYVKELLTDNNDLFDEVMSYYSKLLASKGPDTYTSVIPSLQTQTLIPTMSSPKLGAPRVPDPIIDASDRERVRLYNHLCFYLEPIHDFTSKRHKDEGESKVISDSDKAYLKAGMGKFTKDSYYLEKFLGKLAGEGKTKFNINGNVRDFSSTDEAETLFKTIDILGKDKSSKTIKFTTKVTGVEAATKGKIAKFENTQLTVSDIIGLFTSYFGNKRIFRDAKGTVLIGHLETNPAIAKLKGSKDFAEKLFDGNGPNKLSENDKLLTNYAKEVFNAPPSLDVKTKDSKTGKDIVVSTGKEEIGKHFKLGQNGKAPYILTTPSITGVNEPIFKQQTKSFYLQEDKGRPLINFGVSVKEMSMIMKYYMNKAMTNPGNKAFEEMFWVMLSLKRAGDHGQAERAKLEPNGGVFETLDHLAAAYSLMIDAPTIFTYSDSKKGIVGDFVLTGVELKVSEVLLIINNFLKTTFNDASIKRFAELITDGLIDVSKPFQESAKLRESTISSIKDSRIDTLLNYYELCSTLIQFDKYLDEDKKLLSGIFSGSVGKFNSLINAFSSRARGDSSPPFKVLLDGMMTLKNFSKYKTVIRTFTSLVIKIWSTVKKLFAGVVTKQGDDEVTKNVREIITEVYRKCIGLGGDANSNVIGEYFNRLRNDILYLLTPQAVLDKGNWKTAIIEKIAIDSWLKEETTGTIAADFTELINIYDDLYRVEPFSSSSSSRMVVG